MVTDEQFIQAWQAAESMTEVARRLDLRPASVEVRAMRLMFHGVPLRLFRRRGFDKDYAQLIAFSRSLLPREERDETITREQRCGSPATRVAGCVDPGAVR